MQKRLGVYAMAATAAGMGILASAPDAAAKIVYTPAHTKIVSNNVPLDLNHDGVADFMLGAGCLYARGLKCTVIASAPGGRSAVNQIWGSQIVKHGFESSVVASALPEGVIIGPTTFRAKPAQFKLLGGFISNIGTGTGIATYAGFYGPWADGGKGLRNHFLGLSFVIDGKMYFGWARLNTGGQDAGSALLTGYAYETIPNKPIATGQTGDDPANEQALLAPSDTQEDHLRPATLGTLASGSWGLALWRRDEDNSGVNRIIQVEQRTP